MKRSLLVLLLTAFFACKASATFAATVVIFLTSGTSWTVPQDWNNTSNSVEIIASGATGNVVCSGTIVSGGGGGGAYSKVTGLTLTPGASITIHFAGENSGDLLTTPPDGVWFQTSTTVYAESGWDGSTCNMPSTGGIGGRSANGIGTTKFSGGAGGAGSGGGAGTGAGGGAAGPNGAGLNGAAAGAGTGNGGAGDAGFGGAGGLGSGPTAGGNGTEFDASHGAGGGGGSSASTGGAVGGLYGGGGGFTHLGQGGLIVITYTPRRRTSSGVF